MCNSSPSSPSSSDSNIISGTNEIGKLISDYYICKISKNGRSPLLFNYYVSDIPAGISGTKTALFWPKRYVKVPDLFR